MVLDRYPIKSVAESVGDASPVEKDASIEW